MWSWVRYIPNTLSSLRVLLVVPITASLAHHLPLTTLWLFGVAAVTDVFDGWLARRFGWQSELGGMLDPLADKLMLATVFVSLSFLGEVPVWLTAAVILRDGVIVAGAIAYRLCIGRVKARPSVVSKLNTLCQFGFILAVIGQRPFGAPHAWVVAGGALVLVTVAVSGLDYVIVYGARALREVHAASGVVRTGGSNPA